MSSLLLKAQKALAAIGGTCTDFAAQDCSRAASMAGPHQRLETLRVAFRQGIRHGFPCERENKRDPTIGSLGLQRGLFEGEAGSGHGFSPVKWIGNWAATLTRVTLQMDVYVATHCSKRGRQTRRSLQPCDESH